MSSPGIHPTALIDPGARLAEGVAVGPYAVVEAEVEIGPGTTVGPHAVLHNRVRLGRRNRISAHAVLGGEPQDLAYEGAATWVEIGDDNIIREGVTIHRATVAGSRTRVGSGCFMMAYSHVAHGCTVGDRVTLTNNVCLAGDVEVGDAAVVGGGASVHQFCRVGCHAMVAGYVAVRKDVLPYSLVGGEPVRHFRLNSVGLKRAGITGQRYRALESAFRAVRSRADLGDLPDTPEIEHLRAWLAVESKRGLTGFTAS